MCVLQCRIPDKEVFNFSQTGRALCSIRSSSLDSISTSVSQRTLNSKNLTPHSPSMDTISRHAGANKKLTTKDSKGNVYTLLETASTDCEAASLLLRPEDKERESCGLQVAEAPLRDTKEQGIRKTAERGEEEKRETDARSARKLQLTASLPAEVEGYGPMAAGGVSTQAATEMVKRKHPSANVSN